MLLPEERDSSPLLLAVDKAHDQRTPTDASVNWLTDLPLCLKVRQFPHDHVHSLPPV